VKFCVHTAHRLCHNDRCLIRYMKVAIQWFEDNAEVLWPSISELCLLCIAVLELKCWILEILFWWYLLVQLSTRYCVLTCQSQKQFRHFYNWLE
jgi:hypothetical protein